MKEPVQGGFTYRADYMIREEAYNKLIAAAEIYGNDNASTMLGLYHQSKVQKLAVFDEYATLLLKNSTKTIETHFPSNFVTIIVCVTDCEAAVEPCHDRQADAKQTLDGAFRWRFDILDFICGKLDVPSKSRLKECSKNKETKRYTSLY